jgi:type VI secretion system protein ImpA
MPLRNDLLNPISPDRPAGENLWYAPVYDKIKEARREDDDAPQGDMTFARKVADWPLTIKLISEALATKSKDLQLAVWLAEAMLRREGVAGLRDTLDFIRGLLENFWDGLYPELEDGDADFRAAPLRWLGERQVKYDRMALGIKSAPITRGGYSWIQFRESRAVGSEAAADTYEKQKARQEKIDEGKIAEEVFDKDFDSTPKKFYVELDATFNGALESLAQLSQVCDEKFGDAGPGFRYLQEVLEEVRQTVRIMLAKKREKEPDAPASAPVEEAPVTEEQPEAAPEPVAVAATTAAAAAPAKKPARLATLEPQDVEDAIARIVAAAKFLRQQDNYNPAPYLLLRGLRWGELRAGGATIDQLKLAAPPGEIRQNVKRLALEGNWAEVLEQAETAMGMECGRGWLDLQRYVARACSELGYYYDPIRNAVISGLKGLLEDYPQLPEFTMMDDTPTANAETLAWLKEQVVPPPPPAPEPIAAPIAAPEPVFQYTPPPPVAEGAPAAEPDAFDLAMQLARSGKPQQGVELLMREMMQEHSGRGRFQRKVQVAQLCLGMGNEAIALPILQEAVAEIERRKLEEWEPREAVAHPLAMLYKCLAKKDGAVEERQKLYSWICRLDPIEAMNVAR